MATRTAKKATTRKKAATTRKHATTAKKAPAKKAATKKSAVTFADDIPPVTREYNGSRKSKYDELLDTLIERFNDGKKATARMAFDSAGKATSRYQSVKSAIDKRDDGNLFEVAQRTESTEDEDEFISDEEEDDDLDF